MQRFAQFDVPADRLGQWCQQRRALAHPIGECRPIQLDAGAGVDAALAVQRSMIAVLADQDMRQQRRAGTAALDRQARQRRLGDRLAGPAAELRPDMHDHLEVRRHVFE